MPADPMQLAQRLLNGMSKAASGYAVSILVGEDENSSGYGSVHGYAVPESRYQTSVAAFEGAGGGA